MSRKYRLVEVTKTVTETVLVEVDVYGENEVNGVCDFSEAEHLIFGKYQDDYDHVAVKDLGEGTTKSHYHFIED